MRCRSSKKLKSFGYWVHKAHQAPNLASQHGPVKKKNAQIRCCIDFHDLNNACLEDEFPLSNIDMLVDAIDGQSMFSFTDEVSGYNHIKMDSCDSEKTAFQTPMGNFHYTVMSFSLKNASHLLTSDDRYFAQYAI